MNTYSLREPTKDGAGGRGDVQADNITVSVSGALVLHRNTGKTRPVFAGYMDGPVGKMKLEQEQDVTEITAILAPGQWLSIEKKGNNPHANQAPSQEHEVRPGV